MRQATKLPEMQAHWTRLEGMLGAPIVRVRHRLDLVATIREQKMLPNVFGRWCTRVLKIEPTIEYFESLPQGSVLYVGLRADEEERKGLFGEDIAVRFPMREWGWRESDVWDYLKQRNVCIPKRTDCAICPYQRLGEWRDLWWEYPEYYGEGMLLERELAHTLRSPGRDTWPAGLASLAEEFKAGRPLRAFKRDATCRVCSL